MLLFFYLMANLVITGLSGEKWIPQDTLESL